MEGNPRRSGVEALKRRALVLNKSWVAISTTSVRDALGMMFRGTAMAISPETYEVFDFQRWMNYGPRHGDVVRTVRASIPVPEVILLTSFNRMPHRSVPFNRRNLYRRDGYRCQYCGERFGPSKLSIDHIHPRSRGGDTSWENCVVACIPCNVRKGDRALASMAMELLRPPGRPEWTPCHDQPQQRVHPSWLRFMSRGST